MSMSSDVKGEIYEGLLQKNAEDVKSGAGQYFTPRPLIKAMVACLRPEPKKTIADPCCGSGGFFLAAQAFLANPKNYALDRTEKEFLKNETFYGTELVVATFKLCLMNLYLHNIGDLYGKVPVMRGDALLSDPGYRVDYVLTNPPFGKKPPSPSPMKKRSRKKRILSTTGRISGRPAQINSSTLSSISIRFSNPPERLQLLCQTTYCLRAVRERSSERNCWKRPTCTRSCACRPASSINRASRQT